MSFTNLDPVLQELITYNYDMAMKLLFLATFYFVSIFYLFYYKPKLEKPTAFWSVMIARAIVTMSSFIGLVFFPIIVLTLDPHFTFMEFFEIYGTIYTALIGLIMIIMLMDVYRWGFTFLMRMLGMKADTNEYNKFRRWYNTYIRQK